MNVPQFRAPLVAAAVVLLFSTEVFAQAAPAAAGPFAKTPPLTTQCYAGNDPFLGKLEAAQAAVTADSERQAAINAKIEQDFQNIDPMEKAAKMQQWMMSNPQEAMKFMQATQSAGQDAQTVAPELNAAESKLNEERQAMIPRYKAALTQAYAPAETRLAAVVKKLEDSGGCGFGVAECAVPDWAMAEHDAYQKQRDAAYQATCAQWWTATGQVHSYLKRYRDWLEKSYVPSWTKNEELRVAQYAIMNTPAASWKSTVGHQSAIKYMSAASEMFNQRDAEPRCAAKGCLR